MSQQWSTMAGPRPVCPGWVSRRYGSRLPTQPSLPSHGPSSAARRFPSDIAAALHIHAASPSHGCATHAHRKSHAHARAHSHSARSSARLHRTRSHRTKIHPNKHSLPLKQQAACVVRSQTWQGGGISWPVPPTAETPGPFRARPAQPPAAQGQDIHNRIRYWDGRDWRLSSSGRSADPRS